MCDRVFQNSSTLLHTTGLLTRERLVYQKENMESGFDTIQKRETDENESYIVLPPLIATLTHGRARALCRGPREAACR